MVVSEEPQETAMEWTKDGHPHLSDIHSLIPLSQD
jgi:hypothetical protein